MPSTFTKNNGIEKPGDGEQAGIWGQTVSRNFDILDQSLEGKHVLTLSTTGTTTNPNLLTIPYGLLSDNRKRIIEIRTTVTLGGAIYVRLDPDNAEKLYYVMNRTSGGRDVIFFQGTYAAGRAVTVRGGRDAIIHFDGGGSTATVTELLANFVPYVIDIDKDVAASFGGSTITYTSSNNRLVIDANGAGGFELRGSAPGAVSWIGGSTIIGSVDRSEAYARFYNNGAVQLLYDNQLKLETRPSGVSVTGDLSATVSLTANTINARTDGTARITGSGVGHLDLYSTTGNVRALPGFGQSFVVRELQSDGTIGTGNVLIETNRNFVKLYSGGSVRAEANSTGFSVTGNISATGSISGANADFTGNATIDGSLLLGSGNQLVAEYTGGIGKFRTTGGNINILAENGGFIILGKDTASGKYISADPAGVRLFASGINRLETTSTGISITGKTVTTGSIEVNPSSGGAGLTTNDGYGNANVTFNHADGIPAQNGHAARIVSNVDGGVDANIQFQVKKDVVAGTAVALDPILTLFHDRIKLHMPFDATSAIIPNLSDIQDATSNQMAVTPLRLHDKHKGTYQSYTVPSGVAQYDISSSHPRPLEAHVICEDVTKSDGNGTICVQLIVNGTVVTSSYLVRVMNPGSDGPVFADMAPLSTKGISSIDCSFTIRRFAETNHYIINGGGQGNSGARAFNGRVTSNVSGTFTGLRFICTSGTFTGGTIRVNWV